MKQKTPFKLNNGKRVKRYRVRDEDGREYESVLHCAEELDFSPDLVYRAVRTFLNEGTKRNEREIIRKHFDIAGHRLFVTINNRDYNKGGKDA